MDKQIEKAIVKHYGGLYKRLGSYGVYIIATRHSGGYILGDSSSLILVEKGIAAKLPWLRLVPEAGDVRFTMDGGVEPWHNTRFGTILAAWEKWTNAQDVTALNLTPFSIEADGLARVFLTPGNSTVLVPRKHLDMVTDYYEANDFTQLKEDNCPVVVRRPGGVASAVIMPLVAHEHAQVARFSITLKGAA